MATVKTYIGDGVYAEKGNYGLILTTEYGSGVTNRIVLEFTEIKTLCDFLNLVPGPVGEESERLMSLLVVHDDD